MLTPREVNIAVVKQTMFRYNTDVKIKKVNLHKDLNDENSTNYIHISDHFQ